MIYDEGIRRRVVRRFAVATGIGIVGLAVFGLVIGLWVYPPTCLFAAVEAVVIGGPAVCVVGALITSITVLLPARRAARLGRAVGARMIE